MNASPTDVLDLLAYVQGNDRHKLGELMATGSAKASVQVGGDVSADPVAVSIVESDDKDQLVVLDELADVVGVVAARDHAGVQAVLESGLSLDLTLHGATLTLSRAAAGQLSFTE